MFKSRKSHTKGDFCDNLTQPTGHAKASPCQNVTPTNSDGSHPAGRLPSCIC